MTNYIKYNTATTESLALKSGDYYIGTGDVAKGPTSETDFYNTVAPPTGGYSVYVNKASEGPAIYIINDDDELIAFTNNLAQSSYTTVEECFDYFSQESDKVVFNTTYENVITENLVYNVDADFRASYPLTGSSIYGLSNNSSNGDFINGIFFNSNYGVRAFDFKGTSGFINMSPPPLPYGTSTCSMEILFYAPPNPGFFTPYHRGTIFFQGLRKGQFAYGSCMSVRIEENRVMRFIGIFSDAAIGNMWEPGEWVHVVCKVTGGAAYWYINGVYRGGVGMNGVKGISVRDTGAYIGKGRDADYLVGSISLVRAYDKFLSDDEVETNYLAAIERFKEIIVTNGVVLDLDASNLKSYAKLRSDTTWTDISGEGNDGTLTNGPTYSGGKIEFDGTNDYVDCNGTVVDLNSSFTLAVWFKTPSTLSDNSNFTRLISRGDINSTYTGEWVALSFTQTTGDKLVMAIDDDTTKSEYSSTTTLSADTWYYAVMVVDRGNKLYLYLSTKLDGSINDSTSLNVNPPYNLYLGAQRNNNAVNNFLKGDIGAAHVYDRAITQFDIWDNFNAAREKYDIPSEVTGELVLNLDAVNPYSYESGSSGTTWTDVSGQNNDGTLTNGAFYENGSISFDGTNDYVSTGNFSLDFGTGSFTLSAWIKTPNNTQQGKVINKGQSSSFPLGSKGYSLRFYDRALFAVTDGTTSVSLATATINDIPNDTWKHFVGVVNRSSSLQSIYIDGNINNSASITYGSISNPDAELTIGNLDRGVYGSDAEFFEGNISNVKIYNRALSTSEITQNYNATKGRFGL